MTLQQASKFLDISKKRLWRAVKSGHLEASRVQKGARWEYRVTEEQLVRYRCRYLDSLEMRAVSWQDSNAPARVPSVETRRPDPERPSIPVQSERTRPTTDLPTLRSTVAPLERSTQDIVPDIYTPKNHPLSEALSEQLAQAQSRNRELELQAQQYLLKLQQAEAKLHRVEARERELSRVEDLLSLALRTLKAGRP